MIDKKVNSSVVTNSRPKGDVSKTQIQQRQAKEERNIRYYNNNDMNKKEHISYITTRRAPTSRAVVFKRITSRKVYNMLCSDNRIRTERMPSLSNLKVVATSIPRIHQYDQ